MRNQKDKDMAQKRTIKRFSVFVLVSAIFLLFLWLFSGAILSGIGQFLILDQKPVASDVVVVLNTGMEYYPRLIEAADLYRKGLAKKVVINGNRKTDVLRGLEKRGFKECCPWYETFEYLGKGVKTASGDQISQKLSPKIRCRAPSKPELRPINPISTTIKFSQAPQYALFLPPDTRPPCFQVVTNLAPLFILNAICLHIVSHVFLTIVVNLAL